MDDCGVIEVPRGSLRSAPVNASRPTCQVRLEYASNIFSVDEDITEMIDWFYVVAYERQLMIRRK